jgi:hypothetical protein
MRNGLERMWKEVVMDLIEVLSPNSSWMTVSEKQENQHLEYPAFRASFYVNMLISI